MNIDNIRQEILDHLIVTPFIVIISSLWVRPQKSNLCMYLIKSRDQMSSSQKDENGAGESMISAVARGNRPL